MSKKELEKRKKERKKEKLKRKEIRKADNAPKSFEDMIAYVDEFGNITDTPPETDNTEKIDLGNILISTPKKENIENILFFGTVDFYNSEKGYGFIKNSSSDEKNFFHINDAYSSISEGQNVTYRLERGERGMNAVGVTLKN